MGIIYHYCSLDTFVQIVKNKTIRLSDLDKTNDFMEKKMGSGAVTGGFKKRIRK